MNGVFSFFFLSRPYLLCILYILNFSFQISTTFKSCVELFNYDLEQIGYVDYRAGLGPYLLSATKIEFYAEMCN